MDGPERARAAAQGAVPVFPVELWRAEPFRIFFPLGVLLGWLGIGHWLLYTTGVTTTYSCVLHGSIQTQAFLMAFAVGFLMTAIPRRTQGAHPSTAEIVGAASLLTITTGAALGNHRVLAQLAYGALFLLLLGFAVRRLRGRAAGRRPPAAFVLIPIAAIHGIAGAALNVAAAASAGPDWAAGLGRLLVEQGVFLCLAVGVGSLVLPLMGGATPPPDLGSSPRESWKAAVYGVAGLCIFASLLGEQLGWHRGGPLLRAVVVAASLGLGAKAWRPPGKPGLHRRLVWIAAWLLPLGLAASGVLFDYRVPALHITFIGGFSLLAFGVATHVTFAHLDLEHVARGRPPAVAILGVTLLLAMLARVSADWSDTYFAHVGWASALWLAGSAVWLFFVSPKLLRRGAAASPSGGPPPVANDGRRC
jgi:uncharacterized protein involved in response to NO